MALVAMSRPSYCRHEQACPVGTSRWIHGQRIVVEQAVQAGTVTERDARRLLALWRVPMTPRKVYTGAIKKQDERKLW